MPASKCRGTNVNLASADIPPTLRSLASTRSSVYTASIAASLRSLLSILQLQNELKYRIYLDNKYIPTVNLALLNPEYFALNVANVVSRFNASRFRVLSISARGTVLPNFHLESLSTAGGRECLPLVRTVLKYPRCRIDWAWFESRGLPLFRDPAWV